MNRSIKLLLKQVSPVALVAITVALSACENDGSVNHVTVDEEIPADAGVAVVADEFVLSVFHVDANDEPWQVDDVVLDQDSQDRNYILYP